MDLGMRVMRTRAAMAAFAAMVLPVAVYAQPVSGLYVGAGAGVNLMQPEKYRFESTDTFQGRTFAGSSTVTPRNSAGVAAIGSMGFGFGNGLRVETEGDYRYNDQSVDGRQITGKPNREQKFGGMANLLFDLDIGVPYLFPYFGGGVGYMHVDRPSGYGSNGALAYQGIFGLSAPIPFIPGLSATLEYRFMGLADSKRTENSSSSTPFGPMISSTTQKDLDDYNHSIQLGLRYAFNTAPPVPVASPPATTSAAPTPARTYLVFFDWDRSDLTDRARQIVAEAAQNSTRVQTTQIEVQGNADRSGTPAYNQRLSLRRAQTVAAELVRDGVNQSEIAIQAFGDTRPLVRTAAGIREPQNRRVEIILR